MDKKLQSEYLRLFSSMDLSDDSVDYAKAERHMENLIASPYFSTTAVSIFDNCRQKHLYESDYHRQLFMDEDGVYRDMHIHPDDIDAVIKNAISVLRHVFNKDTNMSHFTLIRQYRVKINGIYKRITEELKIIESNKYGVPWLSMSIVTISPDQEGPYIVKSLLIDAKKGDTFNPLDEIYDRDTILTSRELEILRKISQGLLSKEIADILGVSVHTVNTHRQRILAKLKVNNSIEAVKYATALGLMGSSSKPSS